MSHEEKGLQNEFTVKIIDTRARNIIRSTSVFICVFGGPIALGVFLNNDVMQWLGFVGFLLIMILVLAAMFAKDKEKALIETGRLKRFNTVEDAIKYLDALSGDK